MSLTAFLLCIFILRFIRANVPVMFVGTAVGVEEEQPNTRDTAPPGANEAKEGQVKGKNAAREHTWADVVKGSVRGAKRSALLASRKRN